MPIYEYQCKQCGHHLEELEKVSDAPLVDCPKCGKPGLQRIVSHTSFQLKGGGWYATDYKKASKPEAKPESNTTETTDTTKPDSTKTEASKSDSTAEGKKKSSD